MRKERLEYKCIDYSKWDLSGKGKNILSFLNKTEKIIWNASFPYQDKRDDIGHAEIVTYFALQLLKYFNGMRKIVIPASILHDIGYDISPIAFREACCFGISGKEREVRLEHQVRGSLIAYEILNQIKYPLENIAEVMRTILNHDTRILNHQGFNFNLTLNEKIVRDADVLWRFTKPCMNSYHKNKSPEELLKIMEKELSKENSLYTEISKQIAIMEIKNTLSTFTK